MEHRYAWRIARIMNCLPSLKLSLLKFNGDQLAWKYFRDLFKAMIDNINGLRHRAVLSHKDQSHKQRGQGHRKYP